MLIPQKKKSSTIVLKSEQLEKYMEIQVYSYVAVLKIRYVTKCVTECIFENDTLVRNYYRHLAVSIRSYQLSSHISISNHLLIDVR